jgi:hypothetical protein
LNACSSAVVAQLVEHSAVNRAVAGSSPADGVIYLKNKDNFFLNMMI